MGKIVLYLATSPDGFITGAGDDMETPLGRCGGRLHDWLREGRVDPASHRPIAPIATGRDPTRATWRSD